ncbi:Na+/H+ antiporter [Halovivax ruber XH-70]|uniref:Na+/H+ antiporter n=1 Tax=Halovivax ruber (strain DSM 18193 / JCM 13892 / XH-70) TaxID=797302 RepID=L0IAX2_HALRX|nr:Na+/H+ antiporter NhaC family protein [Halovivax ruber]AGB16730.1 Na+/H+ antiporter [Halovivax ruber XH-70]
MSEFGVLSLVPPLLAIGLAIITRKAVLSLFLGIWSGAVLYAGGPSPLDDPVGWLRSVAADGFGIFTTFDWIVAGIIADDGFYVQILVFTLLLGAGVSMIWNLGGSYAVRDWALERIETQRGATFAAWLLGLVMFFDDYANTAIVGSTIKDVSDELHVSREKLSYIVDSTAAPVATLAISSWIAFQLGEIEKAYDDLGLQDAPEPMEIFLQSIPYNMYAILAIVMVLIIVVTGRDYGEMLTAEHRSRSTGKVTRDDAQPMQDVEGDLGDPHAENPRLASFFTPVVVLAVVTLGTALWTGLPAEPLSTFIDRPGDTVFNAFIDASYASALVYGSFAMVVSGFVLGKVYGIMDAGESTGATIEGFGLMLTAVSILVLAWGIGTAVTALDTGGYVSNVIGESLPIELLPVVVLGAATFIAFSTGTAWGTMAILTPIGIPVAWSMAGDHTMVAVIVGMIFSGAIFGDHSSPISDTSVLSATFTGADLIDHVRTQIPYALTVGLVSALLITVWGFTRITPFILLPIGVVLLTGLVYGLSEFDARRKGVEPIAANGSEYAGDPVTPGSESDVSADGGSQPE